MLIPAALVALLVSRVDWRRLDARATCRVRAAAFAAVLAGGLAWAWALRWASDDAYISFRYADNLAHGRGLVFNAGERVEGYTNFLWTLIVTGFIRLGIDPGQAAIALALLSFLALMVVLRRLTLRLRPGPAPLLDLAPVLAAGSYTMASFATSGLETMFAALLVLVAVERAESRRPGQAGLSGILAVMAHPDHAVFYLALGLVLAAARERRRELIPYLLPALLLYLPYFFWRWRYYGDLMPNTFYAKSADSTYFSQGGVYLLVSGLAAGLWAVTPLALVGAAQLRRTVTGRFALVGLPLYLFYVAKIGGDFMLGRLLTPVLALLFLLADVGLRSSLLEGRSKTRVLLALLTLLSVVPAQLVRRGEIYHHIADERTFVELRSFAPMAVDAGGFRIGRELRALFTDRGLAPRVGIWSIGMAAYISGLPVFDLRGLTSRSVAHRSITTRGRPGHEKEATASDVLAAGVDISELRVYPEPYRLLSRFFIAGVNFDLVRYDPVLVAALPPSARLAAFPRHLDETPIRLGPEGPARLDCDLWYLGEYYFSRNEDARRREAAVRASASVDPARAAVAGLQLETRDLSGLGWRALRSFDSFTSGGSAGSRTSAPFTLAGEIMTLMVGGNLAPAEAHVDLVVDGRAVRSATGCNSEWPGRRVWDLRPYRGQQATVVIVDRASAPQGPLVVVDVVEWSRR